MTFVFIMEPLETVIMEKDTSFILMHSAFLKGHDIVFATDGDLVRKDGRICIHGSRVIPQLDAGKPFKTVGQVELTEDEFDAVFVRSDPPFDAGYLMNTWLLDLLPPHIPVLNRPAGIRTVNEKVWASQFTDLMPNTMIGRRREDLLAFLQKEQLAIAKPTDGFGGQGVFRLKAGDSNVHVILETLTDHWCRDIILQAFVPEAVDGDKRILLLDGDPLGAVLRLHAADDHRNNFFSGGKAVASELTERDRHICSVLKPHMRALGLYFVGIDVMGDYLIEVNVTSPTCLQEMSRFAGIPLEDRVIEFTEKLIDRLKNDDTISG